MLRSKTRMFRNDGHEIGMFEKRHPEQLAEVFFVRRIRELRSVRMFSEEIEGVSILKKGDFSCD